MFFGGGEMNSSTKYIFVDLDGTLIMTDLLFESALKFFKQNPLNIFLIIYWLVQGRSGLKDRLARRVEIDATCLPYQSVLLDYLAEKKAQGYCLILATASHMRYAEAVAAHLKIFDHVIATDADQNIFKWAGK